MIIKNGEPIPDLATWGRVAGPKNDVQWKSGRSAKESARCWLKSAPGIPAEICEALCSNPDFGELMDWSAEPEAQVRFDTFGGEPSNVDVLLTGRDVNGPVVVAIEAKADESFGDTLGQTIRSAHSRLKSKKVNGQKGKWAE